MIKLKKHSSLLWEIIIFPIALENISIQEIVYLQVFSMITFQEAVICWSGPLRSVNTIFRGRLPSCEMRVHRNQPFRLADCFCFLLGISTFCIVGVIALAVTIVAVCCLFLFLNIAELLAIYWFSDPFFVQVCHIFPKSLSFWANIRCFMVVEVNSSTIPKPTP